MRNFKLVFGFSAFGFLLSFISGLASHSKIGTVFLHALLFAVVFALLSFLLSFVFTHVLELNLFADAESSVSEGTRQADSARQGGAVHKVDFYVEDEPLVSDGDAPRFFVSSPRNIFSEMDEKANSASKPSVLENASDAPPSISKSSESPLSAAGMASAGGEKTSGTPASSPTSQEGQNSSRGFVPVSLGETLSRFSGTEAKKNDGFQPSPETRAAGGSKKTGDDDEELDELPDMEFSGGAGLSYDSGGVPNGNHTEDDDEGYIPSRSKSSANDSINEFASGQDAQLMAKAISTLLANG